MSWNTYDPLGMNRIVKFPELYEIRISVYSPELKSYTSKFYFVEYKSKAGNAIRAGPHAIDCKYSSVDLSFAGFIFRIEYACLKEDNLFIKVTPMAVEDPFTLILVEVLKAWDLTGDVELKNDGIISFPCNNRKHLKIHAYQDFHSKDYNGRAITSGVYSNEAELIEDLNKTNCLNEMLGNGKIAVLGFCARLPLKIRCYIEGDDKILDIDKIVENLKLQHEKERIKITGGEFEGCARAVESIINWCIAWDQLNKRPYTPITRAWIDRYMVVGRVDKTVRGPLLGLWDNLFNSILHSIDNKELSESNIIEVLDDSTLIDNEFPPNYKISDQLVSGDRSQPPIGSMILWKIYRKFENKDFLKWAYPRLKKWHMWWKKKRDGNNDGLLEWGSNVRAKRPGNNARSLFGAKCESGMDNSPLYDDAEYVKKVGTMNLSDIGLNSLYTADALFLSKMANILGHKEDHEFFLNEWESMKMKINEELWNDEKKAYMDKFWNGEFSSRISPTTFYPLLAKIPSKERAELLIKKHLLNEKEFWGDFVIPSISRNDPAFNDQLYWRGRIWPSMNYLVYLGLREYEMDFIALEFAKRSFNLFKKDWIQHGHSHENYNAITGNGDDAPMPNSPYMEGSDRFYSWGALLPLMGIEQILDVEIDDGIRFGCCFLNERNTLSNIKINGFKYQIETSKERTIAYRENINFFYSKPGTIIRNYVIGNNFVKFRAYGNGEATFKIQEFKPKANVCAIIDEKEKLELLADQSGIIEFSSKLNGKYSNFILKVM